MAEYLSREEFAELQSRLSAGAARISVTRSMARHFFINVGNRSIRDLTGVSMRGQKSLVFMLLLIAFAIIAFCLFLTFEEFGWLAMFAVPLTGIFWTVIAGFTTEFGSALISTLLFIPCLVLAYFLPESYRWLFASFVTSIYFYRMAHIVAQHFLTMFVSTSYDAYEMLCEHIEVIQDAV